MMPAFYMETSDSLEHCAPALYDKLQSVTRAQHFSPRTEYSYRHWISSYVFFHGLKSPDQLDERSVKEFLSYLATSLKVSPAKQNQALSALDFLYSQVLKRPLKEIRGFIKAGDPSRSRMKQGDRNRLGAGKRAA